MAREMKDSGVAWIGEIPADWNVIAFWQAILRMGTGLNPRDNFQLTKTDPLYYVTIRNFKDGHLFLDDGCDRISKDAWEVIQERSDLQKGDILFASISKDGQAYILESDPVNWNINESVFCIRVNPEYFTEKYFYYHLINAGYYEDLRMDATGSTFQSIKQNKLRKSRMVLPPLSEQKRISDCLDHKCLEIDSVIADTQRTIEEYKKLKQSVITEAVTKGIRGERPMKDSGIEWIGAIPVEWEVTKFKKLGYCRNGLTYSPENQCGEEGTLVLRSSNIQNGMLDFSDCVYVNCSVRDDLMVRPNDILICSRNGSAKLIGKNAIIPDGLKASFGAFMMIYRCQSPKYMQYILSSHIFSYYLGTFLTVSVNQLTGKNFDNIQFPYTDDYLEQEEIITYLDKKCSEIDRLIESKQQLLIELESYKKSVIYEYVTGKKEVPACQ